MSSGARPLKTLLALAAFLWPAAPLTGQSGLPRGDAIRHALEQPRISGYGASPADGSKPASCFKPRSTVEILGTKFGSDAAGRKVFLVAPRETPVRELPVVSWSETRISVRLDTREDEEGRFFLLFLRNPGGEWAATTERSFKVCYEATFLVEGRVQMLGCSTVGRVVKLTLTGPARREKTLHAAPGARTLAFVFEDLSPGRWKVELTAWREGFPPQTPWTPGSPMPQVVIRPPGPAPPLPGCRLSHWEPPSRDATLTPSSRQARGQDFVERETPTPRL